MTPAEQVLELARWAPSGDNAQPWRFRLLGATRFEVLGYDTRASCVYDLDGEASRLAHGMLLETIAVAGTTFGMQAMTSVPDEPVDGPIVYNVRLESDASTPTHPLADAIASRTVQRRPMHPRRLSAIERDELNRAAAPLEIAWFETLEARRRVASVVARAGRIRLTIPEAYAVHQAVIRWHATTSVDRMPDASLGANPVLLAMMRYAMKSWDRVARVNRVTGTLGPRLMLDYIPALMCSAEVALLSTAAPRSLAQRIEAGRAIQRIWLTAERLGLQMQPLYGALVFARYASEGRRFSSVERAHDEAANVARALERLLGSQRASRTVWLARIGPRRSVAGRSLRLPLAELLCAQCPRELPRRPVD